jgi:TldD protein
MLELVEKILKYTENFADYSEVRFENIKGNRLVIKNGVLEATEIIKSFGVCIRILKNGFLSVIYTNNLDFQKIKDLVSKNLKTHSKSNKPISFSEEKVNKEEYEVKEKIKLEDVELDEKIKNILEIEKSLLETKLNLAIRYFEQFNETKEKIFMNSEGTKIISKIPRVYFEYMLTLVANGNSEQRSYSYGGTGDWEIFQNWNLTEKLTEEAKLLFKISKAKKLPKDKYDVVLSPDLVGIASHESCGHPYEADRILGREAAQAGKSFVKKDMLGTRIGSNVVNVVDDPTLPNSYGFYLYDDEGVKAERRFLIKDGMINSFLQNRETAFELGTKSNASSRADYWYSEPIVRMANTFVLPGDHSFEELLESIKKGVYIKSYMEWNIDDKRFNQKYTGLEAYLIENGKLKSLIRRPTLEITSPAFWSSIDAIGKDLAFSTGNCGKSDPMQAVPVWLGGPHIRLRKIVLV